MSTNASGHQHCDSIYSSIGRIGMFVQKSFHNVDLSLACSKPEGCNLGGGRSINFSSSLNQIFDNLSMSHDTSLHQCGNSILIFCIDIDSFLYQQLTNIQITSRCRGDEGGQIIPIADIYINSLLQKSLDGLLVAITCSTNQTGSIRAHSLDISR